MDNMFNNVDFGPLKKYLDDDDVTDVSYSNNGQLWLKSLSKGIYKPETQDVNNAIIEKLAFQCANMMGKTFNMAHPFLDAESAELRLNFVHDSIAKNGIALLMRKTPAKIRLNKEKILSDKYITEAIHNFLIKCIEGHCNIIISGETGSGKTEFLKYLASHTKENEKLITIEDTLELHLDKIFPNRDIVAMKTNNIASYTDVLVTCMRQNPKWILLSEVRSAEAVMAIRNCISSGHYILSTIHADKAESIPSRMYSLLESDLDYEQYLKTIHRYVQLGVHIRGYQDKETQKFVREVCEVCEFYVDENNNPGSNIIYRKTPTGQVFTKNPTKYLISYIEAQGITMDPYIIVPKTSEDNGEGETKNNETLNENKTGMLVEKTTPVMVNTAPTIEQKPVSITNAAPAGGNAVSNVVMPKKEEPVVNNTLLTTPVIEQKPVSISNAAPTAENAVSNVVMQKKEEPVVNNTLLTTPAIEQKPVSISNAAPTGGNAVSNVVMQKKEEPAVNNTLLTTPVIEQKPVSISNAAPTGGNTMPNVVVPKIEESVANNNLTTPVMQQTTMPNLTPIMNNGPVVPTMTTNVLNNE